MRIFPLLQKYPTYFLIGTVGFGVALRRFLKAPPPPKVDEKKKQINIKEFTRKNGPFWTHLHQKDDLLNQKKPDYFREDLNHQMVLKFFTPYQRNRILGLIPREGPLFSYDQTVSKLIKKLSHKLTDEDKKKITQRYELMAYDQILIWKDDKMSEKLSAFFSRRSDFINSDHLQETILNFYSRLWKNLPMKKTLTSGAMLAYLKNAFKFKGNSPVARAIGKLRESTPADQKPRIPSALRRIVWHPVEVTEKFRDLHRKELEYGLRLTDSEYDQLCKCLIDRKKLKEKYYG